MFIFQVDLYHLKYENYDEIDTLADIFYNFV